MHFATLVCNSAACPGWGGDILVCIWLLLSPPIYENVIESSVHVNVEKIVSRVVMEMILELKQSSSEIKSDAETCFLLWNIQIY